jgi:AraC-like DNA-binding protein
VQVTSEEFNGLSPYVRYAAAPVRGEWRSGRRILRDYLLFLVESGRGRIILDGREIPMGASCWYWIPPGKEVILEGFAPPDMLVPYVHFDVVYNARYANLPVTEPGFTDRKHPSIQPNLFAKPPICLEGKVSPKVFSEAKEQLHALIRIYNSHPHYFRIETSALLLSLIANFANGAAYESSENAAVERIERLFEEHRTRTYTLEELGRITGYNPLYVGRLFEKHKGLSPKQFQLRSRINRAKDLIRHSTLTFTAIAEECGFDSLATFSRAFHRAEKVSPTEYMHGALSVNLAHSKQDASHSEVP